MLRQLKFMWKITKIVLVLSLKYAPYKHTVLDLFNMCSIHAPLNYSAPLNFKPSQPQRIISGLRETFTKRYIVERTSKTDIRPEEQSEKAESCREIYGRKYSWKDHKDRNRHKNRIQRSGQARLFMSKTSVVTSPPREGGPVGTSDLKRHFVRRSWGTNTPVVSENGQHCIRTVSEVCPVLPSSTATQIIWSLQAFAVGCGIKCTYNFPKT